jgi:hypothetical protein
MMRIRWLLTLTLALSALAVSAASAGAAVTVGGVATPAQPFVTTSQAQNQVKDAIAKGPAAVQALVNNATYAQAVALLPYTSGKQESPGASTIPAPPITAAAPITTTKATTAALRPRAHAAGCWSTWTEWHWTVAGAEVAWIRKIYSSWCGNGSSISSWSNAHASWVSSAWCLTNANLLESWDVVPSWRHGYYGASLGLWTPWGACASYNSGHTVVRIAANGYWDSYDDYGF